ncbi:hypothetical protein ACOMHN_038915 [Nucella lapillus]
MSRPIEDILQSFIQHVVDLQNENDPAGTGYTREFRILREKQIKDKNNARFPMEEGKKDENIKKNRYKDILPRDDRRVKLKEIPGEAGSDYINASFIDDVDGHRGYIAAQGPMPHTLSDFWRMLWQHRAEIVFMACRLKEDGKAKCEKYWPEQGESMMFGNIKVYTESEEEVQDHFIKRRLRMEKKGAVHKLLQFQYMGWPDHNVPSSPDALRRMIEEVRNHRKQMNVPMVVHCSAGCGRTGTICAIDFAWTLLDKGMVTEGFSMFEVIKSLREQRISMVQTPDQYEYTHMVMRSLCNEWLTAFVKHDYENVTLSNASPHQLEEPEESYYNVHFRNDQSNAKDSSSSGRPTSRDGPAAPRPVISKRPDIDGPAAPRPVISKRPDIDGPAAPRPVISKRPDIDGPAAPRPVISKRPDIAQKPDMSKQKPQEWPPAKTRGCATLSDPPSASSESGGFSGGLRIGKGTAGRSVVRQRAQPRTDIRWSGQQEQAGQEEGPGAEAEGVVYEVVNKNRQNKKDGDYVNEMITGNSKQEEAAPALPSRLYKPEEVNKIVSATNGKSNTGPYAPQLHHTYDKLQLNPSAQPPTPRGNVHRTHQPIPVNPPPPSIPQPSRGGQSTSPRTARRQGQAVADSSSSSPQAVGNPSPCGVTSDTHFVQPRSGWMEGGPVQAHVKRDFPGIFSGGGAQSRVPAASPRSHSGAKVIWHIITAL